MLGTQIFQPGAGNVSQPHISKARGVVALLQACRFALKRGEFALCQLDLRVMIGRIGAQPFQLHFLCCNMGTQCGEAFDHRFGLCIRLNQTSILLDLLQPNFRCNQGVFGLLQPLLVEQSPLRRLRDRKALGEYAELIRVSIGHVGDAFLILIRHRHNDKTALF